MPMWILLCDVQSIERRVDHPNICSGSWNAGECTEYKVFELEKVFASCGEA